MTREARRGRDFPAGRVGSIRVRVRSPDGAQRKKAGNIPLAPQDAEFVLSDYLITA